MNGTQRMIRLILSFLIMLTSFPVLAAKTEVMEGSIEYTATKDYKSLCYSYTFTDEETKREIGAHSDRYILDDFTDKKIEISGSYIKYKREFDLNEQAPGDIISLSSPPKIMCRYFNITHIQVIE